MNVRYKRIVLLSLCALMALNYPWLSLFSKQVLLFGIPLLHLYLFALWFGIILLVRSLIDGRDSEVSPDSSQAPAAGDTDDAAK